MTAKRSTDRSASHEPELQDTGQAQHLLPDEIVARLLERIASGALKPGDQLPSERQLVEEYSVSRAVVREALSQLRSEGLIVVQQGRGAFVAERGHRQSFKIQDFSLRSKVAQGHVFELLMAIEVAATRLAAARRTPDELKAIRRHLIGMEYAIAKDELGDQEDFAFHHSIITATHNPHFLTLNEYLEHSVRRLIRQARRNTAARYAEHVQDVQDEHKAIFEAIAAGDPHAAATAAETHLRNAAKRLDAYLETPADGLAGAVSPTKRRRGAAMSKATAA